MGEVTDQKHVYSAGVGADPIPPAGIIGSAECIQQGETWPLPVIDRTFEMGWDSRCYLLSAPRADDPPFIFDLTDCHTQVKMANVQELMYGSDGSAAASQMAAYYPGATITVVPNTTGPIPGTLIATIQGHTIVVISGTTNPLQWAIQGFSGAVGLIDFGTYSTLLAWRIASDAISNRVMDATVDSTGPVSLIGHSYGGAVACILAARYRLAQPFRSIQLLTFGCPKPGDSRLAELISTVRQTHFVNDDDPVTYLPPSGPDLGTLAAITPTILIGRWRDYSRPTNRVALDTNGNRTDSPQPDTVYNLLFRLVLELVGGELPAAITAHQMWEYKRRIRCPNAPPPPPPPPQSLLLWLRPEELAGGIGDPVSEWDDVSGNNRDVVWNGEVAEPTIYGLLGHVGVEFASTVRMDLAEPLSPGEDASVYMVIAKSGAATNNGPWFGTWPPPNAVGNTGLGHNGSQVVVKAATVSLSVNANTVADEWHLISVRKTNLTMFIEFDGVPIFGGAISANLNLGFMSLGAYNPAPLMGSAVVGECKIFAGFIGADEHEENTYYLLQKFGIV